MKLSVMAIASVLTLSVGPTRANETFDCDSLPTDLLEQSYADRKAVFEDATVAAKYGWRLHDAEFEAATGLAKSAFWQKDGSHLLFYDKMVYQRTDIDGNSRDELVEFGAYPQGTSAKNFRIQYELGMFCEGENWKTSVCDHGGLRERVSKRDSAVERRADFPYSPLVADLSDVQRNETVNGYRIGAVLLHTPPTQIALNAFHFAELVIPTSPEIALTALYYVDPEKTKSVYGASILGMQPDGLVYLAFCTWSK